MAQVKLPVVLPEGCALSGVYIKGRTWDHRALLRSWGCAWRPDEQAWEVPVAWLTTRPRCSLCGKPLVAVGKSRANGKWHRDWASRETHKRCGG